MDFVTNSLEITLNGTKANKKYTQTMILSREYFVRQLLRKQSERTIALKPFAEFTATAPFID